MAITLETEELRQAIAEAKLPICDQIYRVCRARAEQDGPKQGDWNQLWAITSLYPTFDLEEDSSPLTTLDRLDAIPDDRLKECAVLADAVGNADLIARCSDVYWLRRANQRRVREDVDRARTAIGAYIS